MEIPLVDLKRQYQSIKDEVNREFVGVMEKGAFILGENVDLFEKEFAGYCGVKCGVGVNSGTDALLLSLRALGICEGDEVISVPNTFVSTIDAISHNHATPVLVDIEPETYNIDVTKVEDKITRKTKAILIVHMYGHPIDMDPLLEVARENDLYVVEDASHAHGAEYKGRRVGSLGDCACFSFYPSKVLGAHGDAGIVVTDDEKLAEEIRLLRNYGEKRKYHHLLIGYNSRLDELQATLLRIKLRYVDKWIAMRRKNAEMYNRLLHGLSQVIPPTEKRYVKHVYCYYVIRCRDRDELKAWLIKNGISVSMHYPIPIHLQECYKHLKYNEGSFPVAEKPAKEILSLPMFPELTDTEIEYVCSNIVEFYEKRQT